MKKGFTFTSATTGTKYTINLPYFNTVLEAEQYILNKMASLSEIVAPLINSKVESRILWNTLDSAIGDEFCAAIGGGDTGESNIPVNYVNVSCRVISDSNKMYFYKNNSLSQLDTDTYQIADNSYLALTDTYRLGWAGGNFCSGFATATTINNNKIAVYNKILCNDTSGKAKFNTRFDVLMMACYVVLTDGTPTLQLLMVENTKGLCDYSSSGLVGKSARDFASTLNRVQIIINKPRVELPSISGNPTDEINTDTGESETQDSEDNVGGAGNVTLINNIVNYDNYSPNYARVNTGFITPFEVDISNLNTLHSFLYSETILDLIKNYFAGDATKAIVDLFNIPIAPTVEPTTTEIKVGVVGTGAVGNVLTSETATFNFGSIDITQGYNSNSFMDLDPYNKYMIFLPFIGFKTLNTNDIRSINDTGFKIYLKYIVDMLTGDFVAVIEADHNNAVFDNDTGTLTTTKLTKQVINTFSGNMRTAIPLNSINSREAITPALGALATAIAGASTGNPLVMAQSVGSSLNSMANYNNALIPRGDSLSGNIGNLTINKAFVINQESPKYIRTGKSNQLVGYPVYKYMKITKDRGYVKVKDLIMSGFTGTAKEAEALEALLKGGVWTQ